VRERIRGSTSPSAGSVRLCYRSGTLARRTTARSGRPTSQLAPYPAAGSLLLLALLLTAAGRAADGSRAPLRIVVRPTTVVRSSLVTVADVADIEGGDERIRRRVAGLDVAEVTTTAAPQVLSQRRIEIRLLLAGLAPNVCQITGADHVTLVRAAPVRLDKLVVDAIHTALTTRFRVDAADLDIRLTQPLTSTLELAGLAPDDLRLEPRVPEVLPLGRTRLPVDVYVQGQLSENLSATVDIGWYQSVAKVAGLVGCGAILTPEKVVSERMRVVIPGSFLAPDQVVGRKVKRALRPGEALHPQDLEESRATENPILVKPYDTVQVVARRGQLTAILGAAEVLQQGREGDVVRVRNPDSKKVISGRVVSRSELEVSL
jgi:flagella basal body P-ring formation protein FlgA